MLLIMSGAYVDQELAVEQGPIPSAMMFVANKRLFELQVPLLRKLSNSNNPVYLTLPSDFIMDSYSLRRVEELNIHIIPTNSNDSLGSSIGKVLDTLDNIQSMHVLLGDTLFSDVDWSGLDYVSMHRGRRRYIRAATVTPGLIDERQWETGLHGDLDLVLSGFFKLSNPSCFQDCLQKNDDGDFIKALNCYANRYSVDIKRSGKWLDFGHLHAYWDSRTELTTERAFNSLKISDGAVIKRSLKKNKKICSEGDWYHNLPYPLRIYTPAILSGPGAMDLDGNYYYSIEYLPLPNLSEVFVFDSFTIDQWSNIFSELAQMIGKFSEYVAEKSSTSKLNFDAMLKTKERYQQFISSDQSRSVFDNNSNLKSQYEAAFDKYCDLYSECSFATPVYTLIHGDLCFSNILYDQRSRRIRCIDPRGEDFDGQSTMYGDLRYDLAKLAHSVFGGYDHIIAGHYEIKNGKIIIQWNQDLQEKLNADLWEGLVTKLGFNIVEIKILSAGLFSSMLPLHSDRSDRQVAFIYNFIRLVDELGGN